MHAQYDRNSPTPACGNGPCRAHTTTHGATHGKQQTTALKHGTHGKPFKPRGGCGRAKVGTNITNPDPPITERPDYEFDVYRLERLCPDPNAEEGGGTSNEILGDILIICAQVSSNNKQ